MFLKILVIFLIQINLYAEKLTGDGSLSTVQILDNYLIPYSPSIDIDLSSLNYDEELYALNNDLKKYLINALDGINGDKSKLVKYSKEYYVYALLANATYDKENKNKEGKKVYNSSWVLDTYVQKLNGLVVCLYKKENKHEYIIAIGGTTANSKLNKTYNTVMDIWTDATLLSEMIAKPNQLFSLKKWYNEELPQSKKKYVTAITGHSLGGGLAQYLGLMTGINTYTFNTAPMPLTKTSSKELDGGYYEKKIDNPYYTHWAYNIQNSHRIAGAEAKILPPKKIIVKGFENFKNTNHITNIMTENDELTNILKYVEYLESKDSVANLILRRTVLKKLKELLKVEKSEPLVHLIVGKRVILPLKTKHSMPKIFNIMKATNALIDEGIYTLSDAEHGKYYTYHYPIDTYKKVYFFNIKNEPLAFKNISTQKDWVYKYILKMQEYGMSLNGDGKGSFDKSASRTQGEVLKIITKLFYGKNDLTGKGFKKYYDFLKTKTRDIKVYDGKVKLLPDNFKEDTLNDRVTRGDMATILTNFLDVEAMISDKYINITVPDRWKWASYILRRLDIAHGQNGVYGWDKKVTQAESLKFFIKTYEYYLNNKK